MFNYSIQLLIWTAALFTEIPNPGIMVGICGAESDYRNLINKDDGGSPSYGICQIKEQTARYMGFEGHVDGLMVKHINAEYASKYFKYHLDREPYTTREAALIKKYGRVRCAISAYNAGRCIESNQETYVSRVIDKMLGIDLISEDNSKK